MAIENFDQVTIAPAKLRPFSKFIMSIGELPTSYLDSLSYAEQVTWFCDYLQNKVIPAIDNNAEALKEVQTLMTQLQEYVDNYFTNLDVQEEINNKLDDMVEQGVLQEIIADYLNSKAVFGFDNVASMKLSTNLIDGSYAETLGYYSKNDGGKSLYKIRNKTNDDVIDNATIIAINENLIAELIIKDSINVKQCGAYGDNIHDDSNSIQIALNKYKKIFIPKGTYFIDNTLIIKSNTELYGEKDTNLICHRDLQCINNDSTTDVENLKIHNITFTGNVLDEDISNYPKRTQTYKDNDYDSGMSTAIYLTGNNSKRKTIVHSVKNIVIENCNFNDIYRLPIICEGCYNVTFENNNVYNCLDVGFIDNEKLIITNNYITKSADNGLSVSSGNNDVLINNNIITYSAFNGIWISGWNNPEIINGNAGYKMYFGPTNVICTNNIIKESGYSGIIAKWKVQNILISDNIIDTCYLNVKNATDDSIDGGCGIKVAGYGGSSLNDQGETITLTVYSDNVNIINNKISNTKRCGIYFDRVNNFKIHNNSFLNIGSYQKLNGNVITSDDKTYNILFYIHNHDTCNADGSIYDNNYNDYRNDTGTVNYLNYKYVIIKAPYLFILRNYFYKYNAKTMYTENTNNVQNDDNDLSQTVGKVINITNEKNTITAIYNYLETLNLGVLPTSAACASNVTNVLSGGNQSTGSFGIIRKTAENIYDYSIFVPYVGRIYTGRINAGTLTSKYEFSGTYL